MKKTTVLVAALCAASFSFSQEEVFKNKKGSVMLPEAEDYAIGFDAVPMLNFALNAVNIQNNTGQTATNVIDYQTGYNQVITGKYFVDANTAYRAKFAINSASNRTTTFGDDPLTPTKADPENVKIQSTKVSQTNIVLSGGLEKRRGNKRLQGFYGAEAGLIIGTGQKTVNKYEIAWEQSNVDSLGLTHGMNRQTLNKAGMEIGIAANGFVGIEYFVAPKISIAAEYGWGIGLTITGRGKTETETWNDPNFDGTGELKTEEVKGNNSEFNFGLGVGNGNPTGGNASLTAIFHF